MRRALARSTAVVHSGSVDTLLSVDFTTLAAGALVSLPSGLLLTRASAATVQTGTSTVVIAGITTDVARVGRRLDAEALGLVFEESRLNSASDGRVITAASWTGPNCTSTNNAGNGPDGSALADRVQTTSGGYSGQINQTGLTVGTWTASFWQKRYSGTGNATSGYRYSLSPQAITINETWQRYSRQNAAAAQSFNPVATYAPVSVAGDCLVDLMQLEEGKWPSEAIVTAGATATRQGERLYLPAASSVVTAGRLGLELRCRPKGARADYGAAIRLWTSGSDYAEVAVATGVVTVSIGGVTNTTDAITWSQYDTLDLWIAAGGGLATVVKYRVNGGAVSTLTITGSALGNVSTAGALDLLCNGTSNQLSCWLEKIRCYNRGRQPSWTL